MTKEELNNILTNTSAITDEQLVSLETLATNFPYCQIAHTLIAKAYFQRDNMLSHQKIRIAGAYTCDRKHLKSIVEKGPIELNNSISEVAVPKDVESTPIETSTEIESDKVISFDEIGSSSSPDIDLDKKESIQEEVIDELTNSESNTVENIETVDTQESIETKEVELSESESEQIENQPELSAENIDNNTDPITEETTEQISTFENDLLNTLAELKKAREESVEVEESKTQKVKTEEEKPLEGVDNAIKEDIKETQSEEIQAKSEVKSTKKTKVDKKPSKQKPTRATVNKAEAKKKDESQSITRRKPTRAPKKHIPSELENEISNIKLDDTLGYKIQTSRLGEALQERDETTPSEAQEFYPDLMLEYLSSRKKKKRITSSTKKKSQDIINKFIKTEPRIEPVKEKELPKNTEDLSVNSTVFNPKLISENLAKINVRQGNIKRAILIYQELILKYPEKRTFFASEIEKLKNN